MCAACFSAFAVARNTGAGAVSTYRRVIGATALLTLPAGFGISLVADPVVRLLLGPKWLAAIPLTEVFGIGYVLNVFGLVAGTMMNAHGHLRSNFRTNFAATLLRLILVPLLLLRFGLIGRPWVPRSRSQASRRCMSRPCSAASACTSPTSWPTSGGRCSGSR